MTHKHRVLQLLADRQPHSHLEGYRLGVMLHSRVADLRRDGYEIKCWHEDSLYLYQLFGTVRETQGQGSAATGGNPGSRGPSFDAGGPTPEPPLTVSADEGVLPPAGLNPVFPDEGSAQLLIWEAA